MSSLVLRCSALSQRRNLILSISYSLILRANSSAVSISRCWVDLSPPASNKIFPCRLVCSTRDIRRQHECAFRILPLQPGCNRQNCHLPPGRFAPESALWLFDPSIHRTIYRKLLWFESYSSERLYPNLYRKQIIGLNGW